MASDRTALGDRMKGYEQATRYVLPRRTYAVIRVDGKAFHAYLRGAQRPFDADFMAHMDGVAADLCKEVAGAALAFTHSDEVSVVVTDFGSEHTEPWLGGVVQKFASIAAAVATAALNERRPGARALFDGRVFTLPSAVEVANYLIWRQRDCVRNSISMAAQAHFPHKRLQDLNGDQMQELLWAERGVNWNDYPAGARRGRICRRVTGERDVTYTDKRTGEVVSTRALRSWWETAAAPRFSAASPDLAALIPALPILPPSAA